MPPFRGPHLIVQAARVCFVREERSWFIDQVFGKVGIAPKALDRLYYVAVPENKLVVGTVRK